MHTVLLSFSDNDAKKMLEGLGLDIRFQDMEFELPQYHNTTCKEVLKVWVIINPYTQQPELLSVFFKRYLESKKKDLFLTVDNKLDVYKLFDKR